MKNKSAVVGMSVSFLPIPHRLMAVIAVMAIVSLTNIASAGVITAATKNISEKFEAPTGNATFSVLAYSKSGGSVNQLVQYLGPPTFQAVLGGGDLYKTESIKSPLPNAFQVLTPLVGNKADNKALYPGLAPKSYVESMSGGLSKGYASFERTAGGAVTLTASGNTTKENPGVAAAKAGDPFDVSPGSYLYSYSASFTMEVFPTDPYASFYMSASDTSHSSPLWLLSAVAYGPISSVGDLNIEFTSDPSLGLDDSAVINMLQSAISITDGVATLPDTDLFVTTYVVTSPTVYSDQVVAATQSVPEASSVLLAFASLGMLAAFAVRRSQTKSP